MTAPAPQPNGCILWVAELISALVRIACIVLFFMAVGVGLALVLYAVTAAFQFTWNGLDRLFPLALP